MWVNVLFFLHEISSETDPLYAAVDVTCDPISDNIQQVTFGIDTSCCDFPVEIIYPISDNIQVDY